MTERLAWDKDGLDWPNRAASRFVDAGGLRWHVQIMGGGPVLLLLHGTGAATHSWRALAPLLARRFTVVAPDLPGHGFTAAPPPRGLSTAGMAGLVAALLAKLDVAPRYCAGHSAGAAILCRMRLDHTIAPEIIFSLNGALLPFGGMAHHIFSPMAKAMFYNPLFSAARMFNRIADDRTAVERTLRGAGSQIDRQGVDLYARLFRDYSHVSATLGMMAHWDLAALDRDLPQLGTRLILIATEDDRAVPAKDAYAVRDKVPGSSVVMLRRGGHLLHEAQPEEIAGMMLTTMAAAQGASTSPAAPDVSSVGEAAQG